MSDETARMAKWGLARWTVGLLAVVGLLAIAFLVTMWIALGPWNGGHLPPREVAGHEGNQTFMIGDVSHLRGTGLLRMEILLSKGSPASSYSKGYRDLRNILLVDQATGASRKLLPDNSRYIETSAFLPAEVTGRSWRFDEISGADYGPDEDAPVAYFLLTVRQGQGKQYDLLVGSVSEAHQGYVMRGIDGVDRIWVHAPGRIGMIVRDDLGLYYRIVDVSALKLLLSRQIPVA